MNYQVQMEDAPEDKSGSNKKAGTPSISKTLDVLIIGAGFSGVCMGHKLLEAGMSDFVILEKTKGIGGTWYKNTYPGAACDVPSHFYCFSFAPNPNWSRVYSPQKEIQAYIEECANKLGVTPYIQFDSSVETVEFDDASALWTVGLPDGRKYKARHLVIGSGGLNTPSIPDLPGLGDFKGPSFHTARWQHNVDLKNKNVVIIGSAASAIQAVPKLAEIAKKVSVFQRTPNYISPRNDRAYTEDEKKSFRKHPWKMKLLRWRMFWRFELILTPLFKRKSFMRAGATRSILNFMRSQVKDRALHRKLTPNFELGCKRILISDDFYATLNRDNVEVVTDGIKQIGEKGIEDGNGNFHEADVIVLATGFDLQKQMTSIDLKGQKGVSLQELWEKDTLAYEGVMVPGFPNAYFVTGPNTGVGSTSVVFMIEAQVKFIMNCLKKTGQNNLLQPKPEVVTEKNRILQQDLDGTVWATGCQSWYKDENGKIHTLYPHSARRFRKEKSKLKLSDFNLTKKQPDQCHS